MFWMSLKSSEQSSPVLPKVSGSFPYWLKSKLWVKLSENFYDFSLKAGLRDGIEMTIYGS